RPVTGEDPTWSEVRQVLHEELAQLSERLRVPLVLCYLQGKTQDEAAALLRMSKGTLKRRLECGRALLRQRLIRRGVGSASAPLQAGGGVVRLAAAWPAAAPAGIPLTLVRATAHASILFAAGDRAVVSVVSSQAIALAQWGTRVMFTVHLKLVTAALFLVVA